MPTHANTDGEANTGNSNRPDGHLPPYLEFAKVKDDLCISGLSGRIGSNDDMQEFKDMLFNKGDGYKSATKHRFDAESYNWHARVSYLNELDKFDYEFFSLPKINAETMDPGLRIMLEVTYEAMVDAGLSLKDVQGSRTGVYVSNMYHEAIALWIDPKGGRYDPTRMAKSGLGCANSFKAGRISNFFDLKGPSVHFDSACTSFFSALDGAYAHLRAGVIDAAVVAGCNMSMMPNISMFFKEMGATGPTGTCYAFDHRAEGFARGECVGALWIQKEKDSKRVYAKLVHTRQSHDGYDAEHDFTFPSQDAQVDLLHDIFADTELDPHKIEFVECHGTGTNAGDPTEVGGLDRVFCGEGRTKPLLIGSVKTNVGHGEAMAGFNSLVKVAMAYEEETIPPNINFEKPNPNIPALVDGRIQVVSENTPWACGHASICSYGMAGSDAHAILKKNDRAVSANHPDADSARLVTYAARTEEGLARILEGAQTHAKSIHFHALLQASANESLHKMPYRGFTVLNVDKPNTIVQEGKKRPLALVFTGMGCQWDNMAKNMFQIRSFDVAMKKMSQICLKLHDVDIYSLLKSGMDVSNADRTTLTMALILIQMALVDVLKDIGLKPDYILGHSMGESPASYADGCLTAEEAIGVSYHRVHDMSIPEMDGKMAAVGMSIEDLRRILHPEVDIACHNGAKNCTIAGPHAPMDEMMAKLQSMGVFVKFVPSGGKTSHNRSTLKAVPNLKKILTPIITEKPRSERYLCASYPPSRWQEDICTVSCVDYYVYNMANMVHFYDVVSMLPKDCAVLEVGAHALLNSLVKDTAGPDTVVSCCMRRNKDNNVQLFMEALGSLYVNGVDLDPMKLHQEVQYPAPRGTPFVSSYVSHQWNHEISLPVPKDESTSSKDDTYNWELNFAEESEDLYLRGNMINDVNEFPTAGYLMLAWEAFAAKLQRTFDKVPVVFEDFKILSETVLPQEGTVTIQCQLMKSGFFEISVGGTITATGKVRLASEASEIVGQLTSLDKATRSKKPPYTFTHPETAADIYQNLAQLGFVYDGPFKAISSSNRYQTVVEFQNKWVAFLESMLQANLLGKHTDLIGTPSHFDTVYLDASKISKQISEGKENIVETVWKDEETGLFSSDTLRFQGVTFRVKERTVPQMEMLIDEYKFVPFLEDIPEVFEKSLHEYAHTCAQYTTAAFKEVLRKSSNTLPASTRKILEANLSNVNTPSLTSLETALDKYQSKEGAGLATVLREIFSSSLDRDGVSEVIKNSLKELGEDTLLNALSRPDIIRLPLNIIKKTFKPKYSVLEVGADYGRVYRAVTPYLTCFKSIDYTATYDTEAPEDSEEYEITPVVWTPESGEPLPSAKPHLAILKNVLHKQADPLTLLDDVISMVAPGGLIMVQEVTHNFVIQAALEGVDQDLQVTTPNGPREFGRFLTASGWEALLAKTDLDLVYRKSDQLLSTMFVLKKKPELHPIPRFIRFGQLDYRWLNSLKEEVQQVVDEDEDSGERVWLVCDTWNSGAMGFTNGLCREPNGNRFRLAFVSNMDDKSKVPDLSDRALSSGIAKWDLPRNVYRDGKWGAYTLVPPKKDSPLPSKSTNSVFANVTPEAGVDSVTWLKTHNDLLSMSEQGQRGERLEVYYTGINKRDVLFAEGKIQRTENDIRFNRPLVGLEFSGRDQKGNKVAGLCDGLALATSIHKDSSLCLPVPDKWSLSEAATVPYAYLTSYYALVVKGSLHTGQTILVNDGASTVGMAAIQTALHLGANVITTVDTLAQKDYIAKSIPNLKRDHIVMGQGIGVLVDLQRFKTGRCLDVILNTAASLDTMDSSVLKALKTSGQFIEVGRLQTDSFQDKFGPLLVKNSITYLNIDVKDLLQDTANRDRLVKLVSENMSKNVIKPLSSTIFEAGQLSEAFRLAQSTAQPGAVLVKLREEEKQKVCPASPASIDAVQRVVCDPNKCYILTGGMGGMGLELAHWLAQRGARNIVLSSRRGMTTGYQEWKLHILKDYFKAKVTVSTTIVNNLQDAKALIKEGQKMAPIGGIFILSAVMKDVVFTSYDKATFSIPANAKINDCLNLDLASRELCGSELDFFVPFSSISASLGLASQTAYGFGNSAMERICERRQQDGLPGTAIEFGPIQGVGIIANEQTSWLLQEMQFNLFAFIRIDVAINAMDQVMRMTKSPVVTINASLTGPGSRESEHAKASLMDAVGKMFGMDLTKLDNDLNLGYLGLDSLMSVELVSTLERYFGDQYDQNLDIRKLTIGQLKQWDQELQG